MKATKFGGGVAPESILYRQAAMGGRRASAVLAGAARARAAWAEKDARRASEKAGKK